MSAPNVEDPVRLAVVGRIVRRRWRQLAALAVLGALLGAGVSLLLSPGYRTSTTVLLQGSREQDELQTEAQVATSSIVLDRAAAALGWHVDGTELRKSVEAKVADGNVIEIVGTDGDPGRAQQLADRVAQEYVSFSAELAIKTGDASAQVLREQREALRQQIAETNERISRLHAAAEQGPTADSAPTRTELEQLRIALNQAITKLDEVDTGAGQSNVVVLGPARRPSSQAAPTPVQLVAGGALLFIALGVFAHAMAARTDRRLRTEPDVAAALGAPVFAAVAVPHEPPAHVPLRSRLVRLVWDDRTWDLAPPPVAADRRSTNARYRRVLDRLRDRRALVLVPDGDITAARAAARLAELGEHDLCVVAVRADRPAIPEDDGTPGAVVVLTAGTRTGWELAGIAQATADAGYRLAGAVLVHPTEPTQGRFSGATAADPAMADST